MKTSKPEFALEQLMGRLSECLTPESARRVLALKTDRKLQAHIDTLADRHREGRLSQEEAAEYGNLVRFGTFVAILKSKARQLLENGQGE
jgi:hypothetical protein